MFPVIQSLWVGKELSLLEKLVVSSFTVNGHEFHLYIYDEVKGIPDTVVIKDANTIIPQKEIFTRNGSYALFADWFRWELLRRKGNYWVDMDVVCLKPFDFMDDVIFGMQSVDMPNIAILKFPPKHDITSFMVNRCKKFYEIDQPKTIISTIKNFLLRHIYGNKKDHLAWGEAGGPIGFKTALLEFGLFEQGKPSTCFYPVCYYDWQSIFDETLADYVTLFSDSYALHYWNEMVRKAVLDKNAPFPKHSMIEQLKTRYLSQTESYSC